MDNSYTFWVAARELAELVRQLGPLRKWDRFDLGFWNRQATPLLVQTEKRARSGINYADHSPQSPILTGHVLE